MGRRRSPRLSGRSERSVLRQRRLHGNLLVGQHPAEFNGLPAGIHTDSFNRGGGFVGGGVENNLNIFGLSAPGWFMKTEYRLAYLDNKNISEKVDGTNVPVGRDINFKPLVQTISTSLVYRFNWGGAGRCEVLIPAKSAAEKPRHRPGLFLCLVGRSEPSALRPPARSVTTIFLRLVTAPSFQPRDHPALAGLPGIVFDRQLRSSLAMVAGAIASAPQEPPKAATGGNPWPERS